MRNRWLSPCAGILLLATSNLAAAAAQRTFVASSGVDKPTCSLGAPCRSFAAAITATNAGGEVIVLDSAGYGSVTITKAVSIIAPSGVYGGISVFSGDGVTINAPGATVVLRGLSINGQGGANGIVLQAADRVRVESCIISNMTAVGIYHHANNGEMIVLDTVSRDNGDGGLAMVADNASLVLDHVRSEHNQNVGLYVAPTAPGTFARATITDSVFAQNGGIGVWADTVGGAGTLVYIAQSTLSNNATYDVKATSGASGATANVTLTRSLSTSSMWLLGVAPGIVKSSLSDNSLRGLVLTDGAGSETWISGNAGMGLLECANGGTLRSLGNNHMRSGVSCGAYSIGGGV